MSKVIVLSLPFHGHINPTLGLVKELTAKGEEVIYYATTEFKQKIENMGASFRIYKFLEQLSAKQSVGSSDGIIENARTINDLTVKLLEMLQLCKLVMQDVLADVKKENPDYIIHDSYAYWGKQIAQVLGIPAVSSFTTFAYCDRIFDLDPNFVIKDILHLSDNYLLDKANTKRMLNNMSQMAEKMYGVKNFNYLDAFSSCGQLNIVFTSREFQPYAEGFDNSFKFVGPSISPRSEQTDFPFEKLDGRPTIYISLGTIITKNEAFYQKCFEAFGNSNYQVILSVGKWVNISELGNIPQNFIVRNYVPQLEVLSKVNAFITHGGANSIIEGIYYGVPLIVIPHVRDQLLNAKILEMLNVGICIKETEPLKLKNTVEKVLLDTTLRNNTLKISDTFKQAGGHVRATEEIFAFKKQNGII